MFSLLAWILAHQVVISGGLQGLLTIIGGASALVTVLPVPKKTGTAVSGALDTAHSVLSAAALDFTKFTTQPPNGANGDK